MQIISGTARGVYLSVPAEDTVRPTAVRARKALFDSLGTFTDLKIWDLFAGSGALGLEAASRGAQEVLFVEKSSRHIHFINKNIEVLKRTGVKTNFSVLNADALTFQQGAWFPDLIFADPPYIQSARCFDIITTRENWIDANIPVKMIWELPEGIPEMKAFSGNDLWSVENLRRFGSTWFLILRRN